MTGKTFAEYEHEGWERNAADYEAVDLPATSQAFAPMLDSTGDLRGRSVLELAFGTGHLAEQTVARGARVTGIDVSARMVDLARRRVPAARFDEGDATSFAFADASFDVVLCSFGLLHFPDPARALGEACRVLKPGGVCAFTVWYGPEQGNPFFGVINDAYQAHANLDVGLPPAPPMYALADPAARDPMLRDAGFAEVYVRDLAIVWPLSAPGAIVEFLLKGAVRSRMIYERQTPEGQERIRAALVAGAERLLRDGRAGIPSPAVLVRARKPVEADSGALV